MTVKLVLMAGFKKCNNVYIFSSRIHAVCTICDVNSYFGDLQVIREGAEAGGHGGQSPSRAVRSSVLITAAQRRASGRSGLTLCRGSLPPYTQPQHKHPNGQQCHYPFHPQDPRRQIGGFFRQHTVVVIDPSTLQQVQYQTL